MFADSLGARLHVGVCVARISSVGVRVIGVQINHSLGTLSQYQSSFVMHVDATGFASDRISTSLCAKEAGK